MPQKMLYWIGRYTLELFTRVLLDMNVLYHEQLPAGPKIIAPNHPTTVDPFIITTVLPEQVHILVTESAFKAPLFGDYLRKSGHVPVVVGRGSEAFEAGKRLIEQGHVVAIFPEGALSPEGRVARPHTGVTRLALGTGAPVIPVGIALDPTRIRMVDTGIKTADGSTEIARVYAGGPYYITMGVPMRISGDINERKLVASQTQRIMRHIVRLSKMSEYRMQGAELPKEAVETTIAGCIQIPFEIPS